MAIRYGFDGPVLRFSVAGDYTWQQARDVLEAAMAEPRFRDAETPLLVDARESAYQPSHGELLQVTRYIDAARTRLGPIAVIVEDPLHRSLTHMLSALLRLRGIELEVLESAEAADGWGREPRSPGQDPRRRSARRL